MYDREIKRVSELTGIGRMDMRLAIWKVAKEAGISTGALAGEMRRHAKARTDAKKARQQYRATVHEYARG